MRARNLKPSFFKNEELAECRFETRILFEGLWCLADRNGNLENRPKLIKAQVFPYDNVDVPAMLQELARHKLVLLYEAADRDYIHIPSWKKHARPHKDEPAAYPEPSAQCQTSRAEKKPGEPDEIPVEPGELPVEPGELPVEPGKNPASREKTGPLALNAECFFLNAERGMSPSGGSPSAQNSAQKPTYPPTAEGCLSAWRSVATSSVNAPKFLAQVSELNRIGKAFEPIIAEILRPDRNKNEPFFKLIDRLTPQPAASARASPEPNYPSVQAIRERMGTVRN